MTQKENGLEDTIVYNGELYNTEELRKELTAAGIEFFGHSDTEVVLKSYIHWGEKCLDRFNGIFAFAVWEEATQRLFFARDRMGVKPFFYALKNDTFIQNTAGIPGYRTCHRQERHHRSAVYRSRTYAGLRRLPRHS